MAAKDVESVIVKNYPNSFRGTQLKELLDAKGVRELVVIGAMSHMYIEAISRAAADFGYPVTVAHDAFPTMNLEFDGTAVPAAQVHAASMAALGFGYASITTTDKFLALGWMGPRTRLCGCRTGGVQWMAGDGRCCLFPQCTRKTAISLELPQRISGPAEQRLQTMGKQ